jgi:hypothetical protein
MGGTSEQQAADAAQPTAGEKPKSWRDVLDVHPFANAFRLMSHDELLALGKSIRANGLQSKIGILCPPFSGKPVDRKSQVLDGRNRLDAMELVGLPVMSRKSPTVTGFRSSRRASKSMSSTSGRGTRRKSVSWFWPGTMNADTTAPKTGARPSPPC